MSVVVKGCIDFFNKKNDGLFVGGWCYIKDSEALGSYSAVTVTNGKESKEYPVQQVVRNDLMHINSGKIGFYCVISIDDWDLLVMPKLKFLVKYDDVLYEIPLLDQTNLQIKKAFIDEKFDTKDPIHLNFMVNQLLKLSSKKSVETTEKVEMKGLIDMFEEKNEGVVIGGWMYCKTPEGIFPADQFEFDSFHPYSSLLVNPERVFKKGVEGADGEYGFQFKTKNISAIDMFEGKIKLKAKFREKVFFIPMWHVVHEKVMLASFKRYMQRSQQQVVLKMADIVGEVQPGNNTFSSFMVEVGKESLQNDAVIGKRGQIFLTGGSNEVRKLYEASEEKLSRTWINVLQKRAEFFMNSKTRYVQLFLPEKQSVYKDLIVPPLSDCTLTYKRIDEFAKSEAFNRFYIETQTSLENLSQNTKVYRGNDTHLNFRGLNLIFNLILSKFELQPPPACQHTYFIPAKGDLCERFGHLNLYEQTELPVVEKWEWGMQKPELVKSFDPPNGGHLGKERIWKNPSALCNKKIVVFGGSTFNTGDMPLHLTWWLARYFAETHFVWKMSVDYKEFLKTNPTDYIVFQTIERFLTQAPSH